MLKVEILLWLENGSGIGRTIVVCRLSNFIGRKCYGNYLSQSDTKFERSLFES